ncbi:MAG TPA: SRPBCC domain-containing protein [Streptosporangiaceae bacterium]|nr:SRPBCC domain-containing protein [Streptosporangiaceae bacterium]
MSEFHITEVYSHSVQKLWHALTDPELVPLWTSTGRGGRPEGFSAEVGNHFRFVGKPVPGWKGIVDCEVLAVEPPMMLRHTWKGDEGKPSVVTWRIEPTPAGSRLTYDHTGFQGIDGIIMSKFVLGPIRRRMLRTGLPAVLDAIDDSGHVRPGASLSQQR